MALSFQNKIRTVGAQPTTTPPASANGGLSFASKIRPVTPTEEPEKKDGLLMGMAKAIVTAPATMVARPFQAAQSLGQVLGSDPEGLLEASKAKSDQDLKLVQLRNEKRARGEDTSRLDKYIRENINGRPDAAAQEIQNEIDWKPSSGGIVAPAPENLADLKKDVGRGIQTVALGVGSPISAGAGFGFGSSLEQGNDVLSLDTLTSTLVGMGFGKALDLVGKPLLNASGKVIGTITPKILKDVAGKGSNAVSNFMKQHELLGGVVKPVAEKITKGAEAFDKGVNKLFTGTRKAISSAAKSQYPDFTDDTAKYYEKTEMDKLMKPTKESGPTFVKAKEVAKQAEARGIDLKKVAARNKVYTSDHVVDGRYSTGDIAEALSDDAVSGGATVFRPALAEAEGGAKRVPLSEVRQRIESKIRRVPDRVLSPEQKEDFIQKMYEEYADNSSTALVRRNGYSLTNLYDSKLQTSSKLYKEPKGGGVQTLSDNLTGQRKKIESDVFKELLIENAPPELKIPDYFKAQEEKFMLANYLRTLDGKKAVRTLFQRGVKRSAQLFGATFGAEAAGPFGMFSGYQFGGMMADTFNNASNPVKIAFLKNIGKTPPEIYGIMRQYVTEAEALRLTRPLLPAGSRTDAALQNLKNEWGAIEMKGPAPLPADTFGNNLNQNLKILNNTKQLPSPSERIITPNTQGTPNPVGAPYKAGGDQGDVGGLRQRKGRLFRG